MSCEVQMEKHKSRSPILFLIGKKSQSAALAHKTKLREPQSQNCLLRQDTAVSWCRCDSTQNVGIATPLTSDFTSTGTQVTAAAFSRNEVWALEAPPYYSEVANP